MTKITNHIHLENDVLVWKDDGPLDGLSFVIRITLDPLEFFVDIIESDVDENLLQLWLTSAKDEIREINQQFIERLRYG
jgi:hypothetical protein